MNTGGAWIFLSHSHKDFEAVSRLRNELERLGHKPLMFFLKCMSDDSEIDDLVRREIEAREWFLLCDSDNARESRWVRREVEVITTSPEKVYATVDLRNELDVQLEQAGPLAKRATVFVSYHHNDREAATELSDVLSDHDFAIWDERTMLRASNDWQPTIRSAVKDASERGFVLWLLSNFSLSSPMVRHEINDALSFGSDNVIPIALEPIPEFIANAPEHGFQVLDWSRGSIRKNAELLVIDLKRRKMQ